MLLFPEADTGRGIEKGVKPKANVQMIISTFCSLNFLS